MLSLALALHLAVGGDHRPWTASVAFTGRGQRPRFEASACERGRPLSRHRAWCRERTWARFCLLSAGKAHYVRCKHTVRDQSGR